MGARKEEEFQNHAEQLLGLMMAVDKPSEEMYKPCEDLGNEFKSALELDTDRADQFYACLNGGQSVESEEKALQWMKDYANYAPIHLLLDWRDIIDRLCRVILECMADLQMFCNHGHPWLSSSLADDLHWIIVMTITVGMVNCEGVRQTSCSGTYHHGTRLFSFKTVNLLEGSQDFVHQLHLYHRGLNVTIWDPQGCPRDQVQGQSCPCVWIFLPSQVSHERWLATVLRTCTLEYFNMRVLKMLRRLSPMVFIRGVEVIQKWQKCLLFHETGQAHITCWFSDSSLNQQSEVLRCSQICLDVVQSNRNEAFSLTNASLSLRSL